MGRMHDAGVFLALLSIWSWEREAFWRLHGGRYPGVESIFIIVVVYEYHRI